MRVDGNQLKVLGADFKKTGDAAKGAGKEAQTAWQRARQFAKGLPGAAKAAVGLYLIHKAFQAVKKVLSDSVGAAANYQKSLFSHRTGLVGVAREQVAIWGDELKDLGPKTGKGLGELSDALFFSSLRPATGGQRPWRCWKCPRRRRRPASVKQRILPIS